MASSFKTLLFSKFMLASFLALSLSGCLPVPIFEVSPSTATAKAELSFDASGSVVSNVPEDNVAVGWSWSFGDGTTSKGKVVTHTYEEAGTYTVKLTVTDSAGREASIEEPLVVKAALVVPPVDLQEEEEETASSTSTSTTSTSAAQPPSSTLVTTTTP
jgi:PKD repeat protein